MSAYLNHLLNAHRTFSAPAPTRRYTHLVIGGPKHGQVIVNDSPGPLQIPHTSPSPTSRQHGGRAPLAYRMVKTEPRQVRVGAKRYWVQFDLGEGWDDARFTEEALATLVLTNPEVVRALEVRRGTGNPLFTGTPVVINGFLRDGTVLHLRATGHMVIGTRPWTREEVLEEEARRIVRHGMAHVLAWLGEPVGAAPGDPLPTEGQGRKLWETLWDAPENR